MKYVSLACPFPRRIYGLATGSNVQQYLNGRLQITNMLGILSAAGYDIHSVKRILDFGCGAGRMIRWLKPFAANCEIWGSDISSEHIIWANNYLKPPFNFITNTVIPHLPFEDKYFDLIYAGSVFTHIDDLTNLADGA
ncbi:MAG: class I SAM-dependent methyltransferase [Ignavibacteria bacterium]|nr:class I SAM-dependent methyltransferase [Ignavibacteria bacterium]